jgi:hypothetical protein
MPSRVNESKVGAVDLPIPARAVFKDLLEKKRRELDRARTQERIQQELSQVLAMLRAGPVTTKEISEAVGLNTNLARVRIHEAGGVRDGAGLWRLSERG